MAKIKNKNKNDINTKDNNLDYYTPVIIKDNIPLTNERLNKIYNSNLFNFILVVIAAVLVGFLFFYFINYDELNEQFIENKSLDEKNFVFLGDSITHQYDLEKYYPEYKYRLVNSGIGGNTTDDILGNMDYRVYRYNPTDVFILVGTNDILRQHNLQTSYDNYVSIIKKIQKNRPKATIRIISIYPTNYDKCTFCGKIDHNSLTKKFNKALKMYCDKKENNCTYIDVFDMLTDKNGQLAEKYTRDGLHLSDKGYELLTKEFKKYMEE